MDDLVGVAYGAGTFVAVGNNGTAWSSPDGTSWTAIDELSNMYEFDSITFLNGTFLAFGYDNGESFVVQTSSDGSSWTSSELSYSDFYAGSAYGNGIYVAVTWAGSGSPVYACTDGLSWAPVSNGSISLPGSFYSEGFDIALASVAFHDGVFVAVGTAYNYYWGKYVPLILVSTDGINWSSQDLPDLTPPGVGTADAFLTGVAAADAGFVAVGDFFYGEGSVASMVLTSTTGRSWQHDYFNSSLSGAVVSGNGLSAVGLGDSLLYRWWW